MTKRATTLAASTALAATMVFGFGFQASKKLQVKPEAERRCPISHCITKQPGECLVCTTTCGEVIPIGNCVD